MNKLLKGTVSVFGIVAALINFSPESASAAVRGALKQGSGSHGLVSIEAEAYDNRTTRRAHAWRATKPRGHSGGSAMKAVPNIGTNNDINYLTNNPRLDFKVYFVKKGVHYVWVRGIGASSNDDSLHIGLNGAAVPSRNRISGFNQTWRWSRRAATRTAAIAVKTIGVHTLNVWMREDGIVVDKLVLTTNPRYVPRGMGPHKSPRASATEAPVIMLVGENPLTLQTGDKYVEPGVIATDDVDGDLTGMIVVDDSAVDTARAGSYAVTYSVIDSDGNRTQATRTVNVVDRPATLPMGWEGLDIGGVGQSGGASYTETTFTVHGAGDGIWNQADHFRIVYKTLRGNGEISARVVTIENVHAFTKAGVMIREGLSSESAHSMMNLTPANGSYHTYRLATSARSAEIAAAATAPYWVKMVRLGDTFSAYQSADGTTWELVGTQTIPMTAIVYAGLAVTSNDPNELAAATFDNVNVTGSENLDVADYGACAGGDQAAAVQNALNVLWEGGTLNFSCVVNIGAAGINTTNRDRVVLRGINGGGINVIAAGGNDGAKISLQNCDFCQVLNMAIDGGAVDSVQIGLRDTEDAVISGNTLVDVGFAEVGQGGYGAITINNGSRNQILNNDITGNGLPSGTHGILGIRFGTSGEAEYDAVVDGNTVTNSYRTAIAGEFSGNTRITNNTVSGTVCCAGIKADNSLAPYVGTLLFENNHLYNNGGHGLQISNVAGETHTTIIRGNILEGNSYAGLYFSGTGGAFPAQNVTITDNLIRDNGDTGGITFVHGASNVEISNNTIKDTRIGAARTQRFGILLDGTAENYADLDIFCNTIENHFSHGVLASGGAWTNFQWTDNTVINNSQYGFRANATLTTRSARNSYSNNGYGNILNFTVGEGTPNCN